MFSTNAGEALPVRTPEKFVHQIIHALFHVHLSVEENVVLSHGP